MARYFPLLETRIVLRSVIFSAGMPVLLLACAGVAAGATRVVDDDGGADYAGMQVAEAAT